ncbi:hypothetical protein Droror1_Dr00015435 [Drosera rotundifolia]
MANSCFGDLAGSYSSLVLNRNPYIRLDSDGDDGGIGVVAGVGIVPEVVRRFSHKTLEKAIGGFDKFPDSDLLGQVCDGVLKDGTRITVILVDPGIPFYRDVSHVINIMVGIRHKIVIRLIGVCLDGPVKMLVFEFMERGSLASFMRGTAPCGLDWAIRAAILPGDRRPCMSEVELMLSGAYDLIPKELQKPDYSLLKHYCSTGLLFMFRPVILVDIRCLLENELLLGKHPKCSWTQTFKWEAARKFRLQVVVVALSSISHHQIQWRRITSHSSQVHISFSSSASFTRIRGILLNF